MRVFAKVAVVVAMLGGGAALYAQTPIHVVDGVLVGSSDMTLYTFQNDVAGSGKSACNGPCAANWPPLMATANDRAKGDYSVITRGDGTKQWAFRGMPLHYWIRDTRPGDKTGDGFNKVWSVVRP
jgi:predicted lipoprotein with Yx(FWY)xxD motif